MVREEEMARELKEHNEKIVHCLYLLKEQRDELAFIINKQYEERKKLENEMERITYKLCLINKSLMQRIKTKENYDKTIAEIEEDYAKLVKNSGDLLVFVEKEFDQLDSMINKKTSTEDAPPSPVDSKSGKNGSGEMVRRPCRNQEKDCQCEPTKEEKKKEERKEEPVVSTDEPKVEGSRKRTSANSTQYSITDSEVPTKLEKNDRNSVSSKSSKQTDENDAEADDEEDEDSVEKKTHSLENMVNKYTELTRESE